MDHYEPKSGLIIDDYDQSVNKIKLLAVETKCDITALLSNVETTFTYRNVSDSELNASFLFPLDEVAVYHFEAHILDRVLTGECRPRGEAQKLFDEAVENKYTAFLVEQSEQSEDVFQLSIGNIPANEDIKIILKYVGHLAAENIMLDDRKISQAVFTLPSSVTPKFSPESLAITPEFDPFTGPCCISNTAYTFGFEASLSMPHPIEEVASLVDSFLIEIDPTDNRKAKVVLTSKFNCDHSLVLNIKMKEPLHSFSVYEPATPKSSKFMSLDCIMAECAPSFAQDESAQETRTEVVFVIDRSGSMSGSSIRCAAESLLLLLKSLPIGCRFQIIGFGDQHRALFSEPSDYNEATLQQALQYQAELSANMGGTCVLPALKEAYEAPLSGVGWYRQVIFVTDGDVDNANEVLGLVGANVHKARLFSIGIRTGSSSHLISSLARVGRGVSAIIRDDSQIRPVVMKILHMVLQPRTDEVTLHWDLQYEDGNGQRMPVNVISVPQVIPPVFPDQVITVYALIHPMPSLKLVGKVSFNFTLMGVKQSMNVDLSSAVTHRSTDLNKTANPLHRMAGKAQLNELGDKYKTLLMSDAAPKVDDPAVEQLRKQLEEVSCVVNILCPVTALVCVDPIKSRTIEPIRPAAPEYDTMDCAMLQSSMRMCGIMSGIDTMDDAMPESCMFMSGSAQSARVPGMARLASCGPPSPSPPVHEKSHVVDSVIRLADLQTITGSWLLDANFAKALDFSLGLLQSTKPEYWSSNSKQSVSDSVWATALAVIYLELKVNDRKAEWNMFVVKAKNWLRGEAHQPDRNCLESMCEELYEAAKKIIK